MHWIFSTTAMSIRDPSRYTMLTNPVKTVAFTIRAVGQDKFEDVIVPDAPQSSQTVVPKSPQGQANGMRS
jgi:hypothetical protein